jgi:hypothetical protein
MRPGFEDECPSPARTGRVNVVTPSRTLTSNVTFHVLL